MMSDPELFRSQGVDLASKAIIGIKSALQFKDAYKSISTTVVHLDAEGPCRGKIAAVPFQRVSRPMYPLDSFFWNVPEPTRIEPVRR